MAHVVPARAGYAVRPRGLYYR